MELTGLAHLIGFDLKSRTLSLDVLHPSKKVPDGAMRTRKYLQIKASIAEIGLIEPLSVTQPDPDKDEYLLLDGHLRVLALRDLGETDAPCLIAADDETFTYNNRINRLSTIQEHVMLRRAIERGVSRERLARAFNLNVSSIDKRANLLDGLASGAVTLLRDRHFNPEVATVLRKMQPDRQVEVVELMITANAITVKYAQALLNVSAPQQLINRNRPTKAKPKATLEQLAKLGREMDKVHCQYQQAEHTYGADLLQLVVAKGYLTRLLTNENVRRYVSRHQPEILSEFDALIQTATLESVVLQSPAGGEESDTTGTPSPSPLESGNCRVPGAVCAPQTSTRGASSQPFATAGPFLDYH